MAGFWHEEQGTRRYTILTADANDSMKPVHDRMPVMIEAANAQDYLQDTSAAMDMLKEPMPELERSTGYEQLSLF
jgi:putative SOS response-associated peptidase YedK